MSIPEHRFSTVPVEDVFLPPDGDARAWLEDFEKGPSAFNNTDKGINDQDWHLTWDSDTGDFTATPDSGPAEVGFLNAADVISCSFAFDNAAHVSIAYVTAGNKGHLYWYDTVAVDWVVTDFTEVITSLMLSHDDKRDTQTPNSDVVLLMIEFDVVYKLWSLEQRDRYEDKYLMEDDSDPFLYQYGMHEGFRGQVITASARVYPPPVIPPGPIDPQLNLDFELADVYWDKSGDFAINQLDPYAGSWSTLLDTNPINSSTLENSVYTVITPGGPVFVSCIAKGTIATTILLGLRFYNAAKSLIATHTITKNVTTDWTQITHSLFSPANTVYIRIFVESNATDGIVSLDNFSFYEILDTGTFYTVELDAIVNYSIELDKLTLFEVES
jgi:hypothetical protein